MLDEAYNRIYDEDKNGNAAISERTPMGYTTAITDALGNLTQYSYDINNNLNFQIDARSKTTHYLYDGQNNLISSTNAVGDSSFYTYNARGQITSQTDERGYTTHYGYDNVGNRVIITDALGYVTTYEYDAMGRLEKTNDPLGKVTWNEYDGANNLIRVTENLWTGQPQNYLDEYNIITEYGYDGAGNQTVITDTLGRVTRTEYDAAGRLAQTIQNTHPTISIQNYLNEYNLITRYGYNEVSNLVAITDTLGRVTRTEYDELNRTERTIVNYVDGVYDPNQPDEDIITRYGYDADGNLTSIFDLLDRETRTGYDALNRTERTTVNYVDGVYDPNQPDEDIITRYSYDPVGNQTAITDTLNRVISTQYDDLNRAYTITNPLSGDHPLYL